MYVEVFKNIFFWCGTNCYTQGVQGFMSPATTYFYYLYKLDQQSTHITSEVVNTLTCSSNLYWSKLAQF